jgi:hypothetical protein
VLLGQAVAVKRIRRSRERDADHRAAQLQVGRHERADWRERLRAIFGDPGVGVSVPSACEPVRAHRPSLTIDSYRDLIPSTTSATRRPSGPVPRETTRHVSGASDIEKESLSRFRHTATATHFGTRVGRATAWCGAVQGRSPAGRCGVRGGAVRKLPSALDEWLGWPHASGTSDRERGEPH